MNSVNISGHIGSDLELRQTQNGKSVVSFNIAVKDMDNTHWVPVVVWGATAENLCKFQGKGSNIGVTGRLQSREWEDKNGNKRKVLEVVASNVDWYTKKDDSSPQGSITPPRACQNSTDDFVEIDDDGDLPF